MAGQRQKSDHLRPNGPARYCVLRAPQFVFGFEDPFENYSCPLGTILRPPRPETRGGRHSSPGIKQIYSELSFMKNNKEIVKVGVVGCGYWGPNLVRNLRQSPDCHLTTICDS